MSEQQSGSQKPRVALVTGGRRGIGRGCAYALADKGFDVAFFDVEAGKDVDETVEGIRSRGRRAHFEICDISQPENIDAQLAAVRRELGPISCLVNNAGIQTKYRGDMLEVPVESLDRLYSVNVRGTFAMTQKVAKSMREDGPGNRQNPDRSIFFISSLNAAVAMPGQSDYCITKAAVSMLASCTAVRLAEYGIAVHEIRPGSTLTDMTADVYEKYSSWVEQGVYPIARWGTPEDIGKTVGVLAAGEMPYVTGNIFYVDGGMHIARA